MKSILFALVVLSSPLYAAESATSTPQQESKPDVAAKSDGDRMVCEKTRKIGSNRVERVCMTVAQRAAAREAAERSLNTSSSCNEAACGSN